MTYTPDHVNQFHDDHGNPWPKTWGIDYNGKNCWAAAGSMAGDFGSRGKVKLTPPEIRKESGDRLGGANVQDIVRVLKAHGIRCYYRIGMPFAKVVERLETGRWAACLATDYEFIPDAKSCAPTFDDYHMLFLPAQKVSDKMSAGDPLCNTFRTYETADIKKAAASLARQEGVVRGVFVALVKLPRAKPEPPAPVDPCADRIAELEDQLDDANQRLDAFDSWLQKVPDDD